MFDKRIGNSLDNKLREISKEKTNTLYESLSQLNEEDIRHPHKKALNEGAGAGYSVNGELSNVNITKINSITIENDEDSFFHNDYAIIDVEGTADFEGTAESYYDGAPCHGKVEIDRVEVNINILDFSDIETYNDITVDTLNVAFSSGITLESKTIGSGWIHQKFDGFVKSSSSNTPYEIDEVDFHFIDQDVINFIDLAVSGENYSTEYYLWDRDENYEPMGFDSDEQAIEFAKNNGYVKVESSKYFYDQDGDTIGDYSNNQYETIWEEETEIEENLKEYKGTKSLEEDKKVKFVVTTYGRDLKEFEDKQEAIKYATKKNAQQVETRYNDSDDYEIVWFNDEFKERAHNNLTIEEMFNMFGVKNVFDKNGYFTLEALKVYDKVGEKFFDNIEEFDKLCDEEKCFKEIEENLKEDYEENIEELETCKDGLGNDLHIGDTIVAIDYNKDISVGIVESIRKESEDLTMVTFKENDDTYLSSIRSKSVYKFDTKFGYISGYKDTRHQPSFTNSRKEIMDAYAGFNYWSSDMYGQGEEKIFKAFDRNGKMLFDELSENLTESKESNKEDTLSNKVYKAYGWYLNDDDELEITIIDKNGNEKLLSTISDCGGKSKIELDMLTDEVIDEMGYKKLKENLKEDIFIKDNSPIKEGDYIIFNTLDDELSDWKEANPSKNGYKVTKVDRELDGTPTGMYFIKDCPYAIDYNEDNVEKIQVEEIKARKGALKEYLKDKAKGKVISTADGDFIYFFDDEAEKLKDILTTRVMEFTGKKGYPTGKHKFTSIPYEHLQNYKDRVEIVEEFSTYNPGFDSKTPFGFYKGKQRLRPTKDVVDGCSGTYSYKDNGKKKLVDVDISDGMHHTKFNKKENNLEESNDPYHNHIQYKVILKDKDGTYTEILEVPEYVKMQDKNFDAREYFKDFYNLDDEDIISVEEVGYYDDNKDVNIFKYKESLKEAYDEELEFETSEEAEDYAIKNGIEDYNIMWSQAENCWKLYYEENLTESKESNKEDFANWTDKELVNYIIDNFEEITEKPMSIIFTKYNENDDNQLVFNQYGIDATSDSIIDFLENKANRTRREIDNIMGILDDELAPYYETNQPDEEYHESLKESRYENLKHYVEYTNGGEWNNGYFTDNEFHRLGKAPHIKILRHRKGNPKIDRWEDVPSEISVTKDEISKMSIPQALRLLGTTNRKERTGLPNNTLKLKESTEKLDNQKKISADEFKEFARKNKVELDNIVNDWEEEFGQMTLKDWIELTINTFKDLNSDLAKEKGNKRFIKSNETKIIKPLEKLLSSTKTLKNNQLKEKLHTKDNYQEADFIRKPAFYGELEDIKSELMNNPGEKTPYKIVKRVTRDIKSLEDINNLIKETKFVGGSDKENKNALLVIAIDSTDGTYLVDPEGYNYARYLSFIPKNNENLKEHYDPTEVITDHFTPEEQREYGIDEDGWTEDGLEQYIHCGWCEDVVPLSDTRKELNLGHICSYCQDALYSRGEKAVYEENLKESLDNNTIQEIEKELEDILKRNPKEHGFNVDTEEIKDYVKSKLQDKGYEIEISGEDRTNPNKFHIEYFKK